MKSRSLSLPLLVTWLVIFTLIPLTLVFVASVLSKSELNLVKLPFTLASYANVFSTVFIKVLVKSLAIACLSTLLCVLIAYPFCLIMAQSRYKHIMLLLIIIPFWTSSLIRTYALIALLKAHGLINLLLMKLHVISTPLQLLYSNTAVIIGLVYTLLPYMILPIYIRLEQFDFKLVQAARDLGADNKTVFVKVMLPLTLPGIISGCIMVLLPAMSLFFIPNILGGAKSFMLGNLIQQQILVLESWPQGAASSILLTGLLFIMLLFYRIKQGGNNETSYS